MSNYIGTKCISCGQIFKDNDDVVVCPECGTPYHRECYLKEGKCINKALHESGEGWKPEYQSESDGKTNSSEPIRCIRCGAENPPEGIFCNKCGMPLTGNGDFARPFNSANRNANNGFFSGQSQDGFNRQQGGFPFSAQSIVFDKDTELDGVKFGDYAKYVGENSVGLLSNFIRFAKLGGKFSINFAALVFPEFYFFYRKMYKFGALVLAVIFLLSIPSMIVLGQSGIMNTVFINQNVVNINSGSFVMIYRLCSSLMMAIRFLCGFYGNYLYYKTAKKDILKIRRANENSDETTVKEKISLKGGTSVPAVIVAVTIYCAVNLIFFYIANILFK